MFGSPACSTPWRRFGLVATLLLLAHQPVAAQPARNVGIVSDADRARVGFDSAESAGLFIGIRTFDDDQLADVPYAVDDAIDLAHLFAIDLALMPASKVVLALEGEAQKAASRERLQELIQAGAGVHGAQRSDFYRLLGRQARSSGPQGLFIVSVASHGFSHDGLDSVVTRDAVRGHIAETGFRVGRLIDQAANARAPRRLVLLDVCRERLTRERGTQIGPALGSSFAAAMRQATGLVVLSAAVEGGFAYDDAERQNGVFTAAILDGLRGAATADERGLITAQALAGHVQARVVSWVRRHRPEHVETSRGIMAVVDGPAAAMPLAVDPARAAVLLPYRERCDRALTQLAAQQGPIITQGMVDDVTGFLRATGNPELAEALLVRMEAQDGTTMPRESFAWFYEHQFLPRQVEIDPPERRDDLYLVHKVAPGETLISILRRYTGWISHQELLALAAEVARLSQTADPDGISAGQRVRIPHRVVLPEYRPLDDPRRAEWEATQLESRKYSRPSEAPQLAGVTVILDAGHGGDDLGAVVQGHAESAYTYDIMLRVRRLLLSTTRARVVATTSRGAGQPEDIDPLEASRDHQVLTHPPYPIEDSRTSTHLRWYLANHILNQTVQAGGDDSNVVFLSIHMDSVHRSQRGMYLYVPAASLRRGSYGRSGSVFLEREEVRAEPKVEFSWKERTRSEGLSRALATSMVDGFRDFDLVVADEPVRDRVARGGSRAFVPTVLRYNAVPAQLLIEVCNLNNPDDRRLLKTVAFRERVAKAMVAGLLDYYGAEEAVEPSATEN